MMIAGGKTIAQIRSNRPKRRHSPSPLAVRMKTRQGPWRYLKHRGPLGGSGGARRCLARPGPLWRTEEGGMAGGRAAIWRYRLGGGDRSGARRSGRQGAADAVQSTRFGKNLSINTSSSLARLPGRRELSERRAVAARQSSEHCGTSPSIPPRVRRPSGTPASSFRTETSPGATVGVKSTNRGQSDPRPCWPSAWRARLRLSSREAAAGLGFGNPRALVTATEALTEDATRLVPPLASLGARRPLRALRLRQDALPWARRRAPLVNPDDTFDPSQLGSRHISPAAPGLALRRPAPSRPPPAAPRPPPTRHPPPSSSPRRGQGGPEAQEGHC